MNDFSPQWRQQCGLVSPNWPAAYVLAVSPFILRLVQSIKRYADSGLITHLINVRSRLLLVGVGEGESGKLTGVFVVIGREVRFGHRQLPGLLPVAT